MSDTCENGMMTPDHVSDPTVIHARAAAPAAASSPASPRDAMHTREEQLDELLTAASVLSKLEVNDKIYCLEDKGIRIDIQPTYALVPTWLLRRVFKQSEDRTRKVLKSIYQEFWRQMDQCLQRHDATTALLQSGTLDAADIRKVQDERFHEHQVVKRLMKACRATLPGARNLTRTYKSDTKVSSALNVEIDGIHGKLAEYVRKIECTFECPVTPVLLRPHP
jgi:hypothetical protein